MKVSKVQGKLELKNSGGLSLFFIGAGSAFSKVNFQNNVLFIKGKNHVLIDCGNLCAMAISHFERRFPTFGTFSSPIPTPTTLAEWKKWPLPITIQKRKGPS